MSGIKKRDQNLEWMVAYRDLENPGRLKAKQSSNMVFIGSAIVIGAAAIFYSILMNQNLSLEREIRDHEAYISDQRNIDTRDWHITLQNRSDSLINYRDGADKFLGQLETTNRVSAEMYYFYETALKESTSQESFITKFSTEYNAVSLSGTTPEQDMPRLFAEYLAGLTDEEGNRRFAAVEYSGFSESKTGYDFSVKVTLWNKLK